ncbi:MAG TPA: hypothetical protein VGO48_06730 [Conexibacter sp.]|jgi:hypothetical protein|nr:hypothetical protein [Conexibacter sp.]
MSEPRGGTLARIGRAWRTLTPDGRLAAIAAIALFFSMFLPWYGVQGKALSDSVSAFGAFSFVEAAVLLVALAVLALLFVRSEQATFHLPGGDGTVLMAAGAWVAALLVWRLFDKPDAADALVGVQWGIFFALAAAGVLAYAGSRMRRGQQPSAPLVRERPRIPTEVPPPPAPAPGTTATRVLPPERPRTRRAARPASPEDQLTIPLPPPDEPNAS